MLVVGRWRAVLQHGWLSRPPGHGRVPGLQQRRVALVGVGCRQGYLRLRAPMSDVNS